MLRIALASLLVGSVICGGCSDGSVSEADSMEKTLREAQKNADTSDAPPWKPKGSGQKAGEPGATTGEGAAPK